MRGLHWVIGCWCAIAAGGAAAATAAAVPVSVVDAESGAPVAGAQVIYYLTAEEATFTGHGGKTAVVRLAEATTDVKGQATIPAGDFARWPFWTGFHWSMPQLQVFKGGYLPESAHYWPGIGFPGLKDIVEPPQSPGPVKLKKPASAKDLSDRLRYFGDGLERLYGWGTRPEDQCGWRSIARTIVALEDEVMRLETNGLRQGFDTTPLRKLLDPGGSRGCGSAISYFEPFAPACPGSTEPMAKYQRTVIRSISNGSPIPVTQGYCASTGQWWIAGDQRGWQPVPGPVADPSRRY